MFKTPALRPALYALVVCTLILFANIYSREGVLAQKRIRTSASSPSARVISKDVMLRIVRAEDERRWDNDLRALLSHTNTFVRRRAALAAGRIGEEKSVPDLIILLRDKDVTVRAMAAFALGETESPSGANALLASLKDSQEPLLRARILEALGKIAAALPKEQSQRAQELGGAILKQLSLTNKQQTADDRLTILLGLTAVLRAKPANAGPVVSRFLSHSDPRIRADAGNTLARLRLSDGNDQLLKLLVRDSDPVVRANAARVLGATEDKRSFHPLLDRALNDSDSRVRVSAIRALGLLKDQRAIEPLARKSVQLVEPESLEIATALGNIFEASGGDKRTHPLADSPIQLSTDGLVWFGASNGAAPEVHIAAAKISPKDYLENTSAEDRNLHYRPKIFPNWQLAASTSQALGTIAKLRAEQYGADLLSFQAKAEIIVRSMLSDAEVSPIAMPDILTAYAAFKSKDLAEVLRQHLQASDVIVRATAAELLGELPGEANVQALVAALPVALRDKELNDAALAILDALGQQKSTVANEATKTALDSQDYLVRRKAVALLKANGAGDFSSHIGTVQSRNTTADYDRAISRIGKQVNAVVTTNKGAFTIELLPDDAPLTVDNFIQLARHGYFRGITFHRVVPNFVIQGGDPRGDGNGGPGYQIRCEINEVPYERGAVGMALSGKDTGGSQWFVTHSPQPHLDGGYTVFGNVVAGMNVVDNIVRGDVIRSIAIKEIQRRTLSRH